MLAVRRGVAENDPEVLLDARGSVLGYGSGAAPRNPSAPLSVG